MQTIQERSLALEDVIDTLTHSLPECYQLRGWTPDGKVPDEKKQALGLTK